MPQVGLPESHVPNLEVHLSGEGSYSVAANDKISRRANAPEILIGLVGGPVVIGLGAAFLWLTVAKGFEAGLFEGPLCFVLGGWIFSVMIRQATRHLERVDVNRSGVEIYFGESPPKRFTWTQQGLGITLYDYRGRDPRGRTWYKIPCMVATRGVRGGISGEVADAIEAAARDAGLGVLVKESLTVRWVRIRSAKR